jgi:hypothetical protein
LLTKVFIQKQKRSNKNFSIKNNKRNNRKSLGEDKYLNHNLKLVKQVKIHLDLKTFLYFLIELNQIIILHKRILVTTQILLLLKIFWALLTEDLLDQSIPIETDNNVTFIRK